MDFLNSRYFSINKRIMTLVGVWPDQDTRTKISIRTTLTLVVAITFVPPIFGILKYAIVDVDKLVQNIVTVLYLTVLRLQVLTTVINEKKLGLLYRNTDEYWKLLDGENELRTMVKYSELGRFLTIGYLALLSCVDSTHTAFSCLIYVRSVLTLSSYLSLGLPRGHVKFGLPLIMCAAAYSRLKFLLRVLPILICVILLFCLYSVTAYMFSALTLFVSVPLFSIFMDIVSPINGSRQRIFILGSGYPVDEYENYGKIYIFESFTYIMSVIVFTALEPTYVVCVSQCLGLIAVVSLHLKLATDKASAQIKYKSDSDQHDISSTLISISAKLHMEAIRYAKILNSSYSVNFIFALGGTVTTLSVGFILIIMNLHNTMEFVSYNMIFIGMMIHMFYITWPGQKLLDSSEGILYDTYNNEWYECSQKSKTLLKFMMLRSIEPCELTAGGIYVMNMANFGALVRTSISYITIFASFR